MTKNKFCSKSLSIDVKLNINQLLLVNAHLGHTRKFLDIKIKPYLLGHRGNIYILNLTYTLYHFKLLAINIINLVSLRKKILLVNERALFNFKSIMNLDNIYYYDVKWIGGILTNYKKVKQGFKFKKDNKSLRSLRYMKALPSLIFFFDVNLSYWALIEASNLDIPIAALIDTNSNWLGPVNYPIIANNKPFEAIYLYLKLIRNAGLKGRQKELLKILRLH